MEVPGTRPAATQLVRVGDVADWRLPDEEFVQSFRMAVARPGALAQLHNPLPEWLNSNRIFSKHACLADLI